MLIEVALGYIATRKGYAILKLLIYSFLYFVVYNIIKNLKFHFLLTISCKTCTVYACISTVSYNIDCVGLKQVASNFGIKLSWP